MSDGTTDSRESLTIEEANELVLEHQGWCESIAKSVARAWSMDWRENGLDGAAFEALVFCARRYNPSFGVPFKGYARKRIHEASTEAARKSKGWHRGSGTKSRSERIAKEVSVELFNLFPELRSGRLPSDNDTRTARSAIQQLLMGASILATKQGIEGATPDEALDYKKLVKKLTKLHAIHQLLIWKLYWEGSSLRGIANDWDTDELNVIREHKVLLEFMQKSIRKGFVADIPRVRPGLKAVSLKVTKDNPDGMFHKMTKKLEGGPDG